MAGTPDGNRIVRGGKAVYGARLGILMLEARFPRIPGDMGNASSWPFPVLYKVVRGASPDRVVRREAAGLLDVFLDAAAELVRDGADGLTTNCGFLSLYQRELAAHVGVPVATSSLMQVAAVQALLPAGRRVGIITISAASLTERHLRLAGVPEDTPIVGTDDGEEFSRVILDDLAELDVGKAERDILRAGHELVSRYEGIGAIVLECTNMCPYAAALQAATNLPVFDAVGFASWFHGGLAPRRFAPPS
jgi:Asp/Glu/hydantoin racemase